MANDLIQKWGSATTVVSLTSALADGNIAGGTTQLDNSSTLYPYALAVFDCPDSFGAAPDDGSVVELLMVMDDVDGTTDESATPTGTDKESSKLVGTFEIYDDAEQQTKAIVISLHGVQKANFYIANETGQQISYSSNPITVKMTPFTYTPST